MKRIRERNVILFLVALTVTYVLPGCGLPTSLLSDLTGPSAALYWPRIGFTEQSATQNTTFPDSVATDVAIYAPLPCSFADHPEACDTIHFLRIRHRNGPLNPSDADKILVAQPGILEGASAFYNVAGNLITRAYNEKGSYIEFWAIDRRPNCLEDINGLLLAKETGDVHDAIDYYYRNKAYNGQQFKGFLDPLKDAAWLVDMGMEQTVIDMNTIITRGIPDQTARQQKVYCGGHSLGGFITGAYADWDFDGDPTTTNDAGYNQCAGFFGLDTVVTATPMMVSMFNAIPGLESLLDDVPENLITMMREGKLERFFSLTGIIDPEVMTLLSGLGFAAEMNPTTESDLVSYLPADSAVKFSYRFYGSMNLYAFLFDKPSIEEIRYTNQALFAIFMDNNSMPISIVQASMGFFKGGPVADKDFPIPDGLNQIPELAALKGMLGGEEFAIATDEGSSGQPGALYDWANYNEIAGMTIPNASDGNPYTSPDKEVTDIHDMARCLGAVPMNFVEVYFPTALTIDSLFGASGAIHKDGETARPVLDIIAGDGPGLGAMMNMNPPGSPVIAGYHHLDVETAAPVQNNGQPEQVVTALLNFLY